MSNNAYLKAMGIDVWVERTPSVEIQTPEPAVVSTPEVSTPISIESNENIEAVFSRVEEKLEKGSRNIASVRIKYSMSPPIKIAL